MLVNNAMKRIYVNKKWCLGCRLCEYNCTYANSGAMNIITALKDKPLRSRIKVEEYDGDTLPLSCRHCEEPICVKSCIAGALSKVGGVIKINHNKCVGCCTCISVCPYGAIMHGEDGVMRKCELCIDNAFGAPACVAGCPNGAIVYEERD